MMFMLLRPRISSTLLDEVQARCGSKLVSELRRSNEHLMVSVWRPSSALPRLSPALWFPSLEERRLDDARSLRRNPDGYCEQSGCSGAGASGFSFRVRPLPMSVREKALMLHRGVMDGFKTLPDLKSASVVIGVTIVIWLMNALSLPGIEGVWMVAWV